MLFLLVGWLYVFLAPYTKVEESFNLHAIHDIIFYGPSSSALSNPRKYDHFVFPGVVPRSFIGSLVLGYLTQAVALVTRIFRPLRSKYELQVLVRLTLATVNAFGLFHLQRAVARRFGPRVSLMFMLLTCTQFHIPFWMGRTLPNMFALYPVNIALSLIVVGRKRNFDVAMAILTFTAVTLRFEVVLFLGPLALQGLFLKRTTLLSLFKTGMISGIISLALTLSVDSYFWNQTGLWPEFSGLYFNVYEGKSAEWGTSPPHSYFTLHLPKLLFSALPLSAIGLLADARMWTLLFPCITSVALLSCLGHKEWRFVVYVVPIWNIIGARGAAWLSTTRIDSKYSIVSRGLLKVVLLGLLGINVLATVLLAQASMANYPGGEALWTFNHLVEETDSRGSEGGREVSVHIDNYAAQTGASLFLHERAPPMCFLVSRHDPWKVLYKKTENLFRSEDFEEFDWVITEHPNRFTQRDHRLGRSVWKVQAIVKGLRGFESLGEQGIWRRLRIPRLVREPKLWILQKHIDSNKRHGSV